MIPRGGAVVALAALCACAGEAPRPAASAPVRLALVGGVATLDPARSGWSIESRLFGQLADGLVETDAHLQVRPSLAESWQLDDGGRRYRFLLRADATWGEGQPLRADDAVRALTRLALADNHMGWPVVSEIEGAEAYRAGRASTVSGLVAVDRRTLEIRLQAPNARFLQLLGGGAARLFPGDGSRADWDAGRVAGSGPFVLAADTRERVAGVEVRRFRFASRPGAHRPAQVTGPATRSRTAPTACSSGRPSASRSSRCTSTARSRPSTRPRCGGRSCSPPTATRSLPASPPGPCRCRA